MSILATQGVGRKLPGGLAVTLVEDVTLRIESGRFTTIVGPSGCGKSSLLYLLGLLDCPTSGNVLVDGSDVGLLDGDARARLRLERFGFVFQFHFLLPEFTAMENVLMPMRRLGRWGAEDAQTRAAELLSDQGLGDKGDRTPERLSGGERQRVAIARALANDPAIILGDEPTGNLDSRNAARVIETFRELAHHQGRAVVCVTHDSGVAASSDVRISMKDGRIVSIEDAPLRTIA